MNLKNIIIASAAAVMMTSCAVTTPFTVTNNEIGSKLEHLHQFVYLVVVAAEVFIQSLETLCLTELC